MGSDAPAQWGRGWLPEIHGFSTEFDVPLVGDMDLAAAIARSEGQTLKGLFFTRYADEGWNAVHTQLLDPPAKGKYHAFESYPMADYLRLFDYAARARFPGSTREAYRLLARGEVEVFAETTLGKVTLSMLGDPGAAFLRYPDVLSVVLKGLTATSQRIGPRKVSMRFEGTMGATEQAVGVLEGLALVYELPPRIEVSFDERLYPTITVVW